MLRVSVLGRQEIAGDDGDVLVRSSRALNLVGFLAVHAGVPHTRHRVAGLLWPESGDPQALTNLRRELHHLRHALGGGPPVVVTARDLTWEDTPACRADVRVFAAERAAALAAAADGDDDGVRRHGAAAIEEYRGDLMPDAGDDWVLEARPGLQRQCVDLCDLVSAAGARAGDLAGAVGAARRRVRLAPLEEAGYRVLMGLQADLGDRAAAVSTYHHCASVLERELGVAPDDATRAAFQRLVTRARPAKGPPGGPVPGRRAGPGSARLIGRSAEVSQLQGLWRAAAAGQPGLVLVRGGPGIGKTRLVTELAGAAQRGGAVVAAAQCFATPGRLALAPVADWLRHPEVHAAAAALDPAWRAEVARLLPEGTAGGGGTDTGPGAGPEAAWRQHRFTEGLARALLAVGRPLLLVLDNVQWCDQETLAFITFCLRLAADGGRLLVAGTLRGDGPGDDRELAGWIVRMRATGLLTELALGPLDAAGSASLAAAISGRPLEAADAATIHAATGGFPLYVIEAVRGRAPGRAGLPPGDLAAVLRKRLEQVTPAAREVAGLAAAVGANFTLDLLTEAGDLDPDGVVRAVDELWRHRIIAELGRGYDFSHDLLRDTAYAQVSPPRRWLLHRRIAQGLELLHAGNTDPVAPLLAEQYARAGGHAKAVTYYQRAAQVAAGRFAHGEAVRLYRKALSTLAGTPEGRDRDSQELAVLHAMAAPLNAMEGYASPALQQDLERSVALAESLGRKDLLLASLAGLWSSRFVQGRTADSHRLAVRTLALAGQGSGFEGQAHFGIGGSALSMGRPAEGLRHLKLAATLGGGMNLLTVGTRSDVHAMAFAAHASWLLGQDDAALDACQGAIGLARRIGEPYSLAVALAYGGVTHQMRGDLPALRDAVAELSGLCGRYEFAYYREWALILAGWSAADGSGARLAARGIGHLKRNGSFARMPYWLSLLADLTARDGEDRAAAARAILDAALTAGRVHQDAWWLPEVLRMRARYDDGDAAAARLQSAAELAAAHGSVALLRRCEDDLRRRGVPVPSGPGVPAAG